MVVKKRIVVKKKPKYVIFICEIVSRTNPPEIIIGTKSSLSEAKKFAIKEMKLFSKKMELWEDKGCKGSINKYYKGKLTESCSLLIRSPHGREIMLTGDEWEDMS